MVAEDGRTTPVEVRVAVLSRAVPAGEAARLECPVDCHGHRGAVEKAVQFSPGDEDAVRIGNMMLNAGVFHHVQDAHPFENKKLFYRFLADEDHGSVAHKPDGSAVSWADFIAPLGSPDNQTLSLQPEVPQRDPNLAAYEQVDLAAGG